MKPKIGAVLDGYKLLAEIGSGSCGTVFQAENIISKELFALKIFPAQGDLAERELQAVRLYQKIEHPNLIRIHHVGQTGKLLFYTMDWCKSSLARRKVSPEELLEIARKLTSALAALHERGLIHRDIKPDNIFFRNGEIVLGDIGLVTRSESATFAGSPGFLAPALASGKIKPDPYTDCYALAKSLYCALSGQEPGKFPEYDGTLSPAASVVMRAVLAVCSDEPEIRNAPQLLRFLNESGTTGRRRKYKFRIWLSAAFLIILLIVLGLFLRSSSHDRNVSSSPKIIQTGKQETRQTSPSRPGKIANSRKTLPNEQHETEKPQPDRKRKPAVRQEKTEITERRAWNEQNQLQLARTTSPVGRAELEFEIEWNNWRIDLLERSRDRKITDSEFSREERILFGLWKTAKWILKSGIGAERVDLGYEELKEKLTIGNIELYQLWVQADKEWQTHKRDCIRELVRKTKETGQDPYEILWEMAKKDAALRFFGIEQEEYLGEYEKVRFSGKVQAKQEADDAVAKYLKARQKFLETYRSASHPGN